MVTYLCQQSSGVIKHVKCMLQASRMVYFSCTWSEAWRAEHSWRRCTPGMPYLQRVVFPSQSPDWLLRKWTFPQVNRHARARLSISSASQPRPALFATETPSRISYVNERGRGQFQSMHSWMNQVKHPVPLLCNTLACWLWPAFCGWQSG